MSAQARIESLRTRVVTKTFDKAQWNPRTRWTEKNVVLVGVKTEAGACGIGEAYCDGGSPDSVVSLIERDFAPLAIGRRLADLGAIASAMRDSMVVSAKGGAAWAAASAVDIAMWDALGRSLGQPVCTLLGAQRRSVFAYASAGLYGRDKTPDHLAAEMRGYVALGFRGVKIKIGGASLAEDLARVAAVREAIGTDVRLMVDALYAYSVADALRMARGLERYDVHFLEAPVHPDDIDGLARLAAVSPVPLAGNEFAYGLAGFRRIVEKDAVAYVHLDAILCGGISEGQRIAALAASRHVPVSFHAASSVVCFAANLQLAASVPNVDSIEFHMLHRMLFDRLAPGAFALEDGCVVVPDDSGLGLGCDAEALLETHGR
jgi:L-alanine-DL-glutamate epimerase-like enolase superfamily enzyme